MPRTITTRTGLAALALLAPIAAAALPAIAGPLAPPAGPVAPTMKTLEQVEPRIPIGPATTPGDAQSVYRITGPGSYYLTSNLTVPAGKIAISIADGASPVVIDLSGFHINLGAQGLEAVRSSHGVSTTLRNGSVSGGSTNGVALGQRSRVEHLRVEGSAGIGILVGDSSTVVDSIAANCGPCGIGVGNRSTVSRCTAIGNANDGISAIDYSVVMDCIAHQNGRLGFWVRSGTVSNCTASNNGGGSSEGGGLYGFATLEISGCNFSLNSGYGASVSGGQVSRCSFAWNSGHGLIANNGANVADCSFRFNGTTDEAGVYVHISTGGRIERNMFASNRRGIVITTAAGALVVGNSFRSNSGGNTSIVAGNMVGPMVNAAGMATNTNPNANFAN